jgi:WD40 repeat protein
MAMTNRPPIYPHFADTRGDVWQYDTKTDLFTRLYLLNVGSGANDNCAFSPDGNFLVAVTGSTSAPGYYAFQRTKNGYSSITLPGASTITSIDDVCWSPDSKYLFFIVAGTTIHWWKRNSDNSFTKMTSPTSTGATAISGSVSPDSKYLAVSLQFSPFLAFYKINGDNSMTKLAAPATAPLSYAYDVTWLNNTSVLVCPQGINNPACMYTVDPATDVFTKTTITGLTTASFYSSAVSPDGVHVAVGSQSVFDFYKFNSATNTFTKLTTVSNGRAVSLAFSVDGLYLAIGGTASPFAWVYKVVGDSLTPVTLSSVTTGTQISGLSFAPAVNI